VTVGDVDAGGRVRRLADLAVQGRASSVPVPADAVLVVPDVTDATWAKVRFGADGWSDVAAVLPHVRDEAVLVVVHNAIRDAVREGSLDPAVALELICGSIAGQPSEVLLTVVLGWAGHALAGPFSPAPERGHRLSRVHELAREALAASADGSDRQLTAFRLAVATAADPALLASWYEGRGLPGGLELDSEITWSIVERLVASGGDPAVVDEALAADPSSSAAVHAARARAAQPTAAAKEAAWAVLMQPSSASAYEAYATADGFFRPGQDDLTRPYVARYFAEIASTAGFRRGWALGRVAQQAFPRLAVDAETVRLAEQTLAGDLPDPVRREIVDCLDQLRRALTSLERFGQS
jgi:aminopeptidase N